MKSSEPSSLLLNCSFLSHSEYLEKIKIALEQDTLTHIVTLNAEMVVEAQKNSEFRQAVAQAELKIPDGGSLLWAREYMENGRPARRTGGGSAIRVILSLIKFFSSKQQPLTGVDSVFTICEAVERKNGSVHLLGGTREEAQGTADVLQKKYPRLSIIVLDDNTPPNLPLKRGGVAFSPPARGGAGGGGRADVVFVALGSPKQTLYTERHRKILEEAGIKIAIGVGGAFTMISESLPRAPLFMRRHHVEWLWRLILEPKRIKRIWNAVVVFPILVYRNSNKTSVY